MAPAYTGYSSEVIRRITREPVRRRKSRTRARVASVVRFPTTRPTTNRVSGSKATWSQPSPQRSSSGSQLFCFRPTNAQVSSNGTSAVFGGKSDQRVVELLGVVARASGVPGDGVLAHPGEPGGRAGADPFGHVRPGGGHLRRRQPGDDRKRHLADLYWVLFNAREVSFNH